MFEYNLTNAVSPVMGEFIMFHDLIFYLLLAITLLVSGIMGSLCYKSYLSLSFMEYSLLEMVWTIMPGMVLFCLAIPSLKLLYYMDLSMEISPEGSVKVLGYQWYWKYSCKSLVGCSMGVVDFDSYMVCGKGDLGFGDLRLLEVDLPLVVPAKTFMRLVVGSSDVIHSFTINGLGLKVDAVPGRLKTGFFYSSLYGSFFGQCSEMCGVNHSFMPVGVEVINF